MSYLSEITAIVDRFASGTSIAAVDYAAGNLPGSGDGGVFQTPTVDPANPDAAIWARITVAPVPRAVAPVAGVTRPGPVGLGPQAPTYREGLITVQHFAPRASGGAAIFAKVDETRALFDRARFGPVVCRDTDSPDPEGYEESGEWWQINTTTPYYVLEDTP